MIETPLEVADVLAGGRHEERLVEAVAPVFVVRLAAVFDRELELLLVVLDRAAEGDEAVRLVVAGDRSARVDQLEVDERLAVAVLAQLLLGQQSVALNRVARLLGADRRILFGAHAARRYHPAAPKRRARGG